jgi:hypothetical protein
MSFSLNSIRHAISRSIEADERITKEHFETFISIVASLCGMVHGFIATQSDLIIASHYLQEFEPDHSDQGIFQAHFLNVFYAGCLLGTYSLTISNLHYLNDGSRCCLNVDHRSPLQLSLRRPVW